MKEDKNKFSSLNDSDERVGLALSRVTSAMQVTGADDCPGPETIAAVVEGSASAEERDRVLKHVSACESCYELFFFTRELHEEESVETEKKKIIPFKPLALAASLLIVMFSIYIFYKSDEIPKTPHALMEKSDALEEEFRMKTEEPVVSKAAEFEDKETEAGERRDRPPPMESPPPAPKKTASKKAAPKKGGIARDKFADLPKARGFKKRYSLKAGVEAAGKKDAPPPKAKKESADVSPETQETQDTRQVEITNLEEMKQQKIQRPAGMKDQKRSKKAAQRTEADEVGQAVQYNLDGLDTTKAPLQQQAAFLNYQVREVKTYLPQKKLGKLFKETVVLSQQMAKEFETVQRAVVKSGVSNEVDDYVNDLRPLMTVETVGSQSYIFPDVDWFQSKSSPRTVEYQFFNLARSGWCVGSRLCNTRKVDQEESQQLLVQWQALQPQLDGVFKQVATQTIDRLKKE